MINHPLKHPIEDHAILGIEVTTEKVSNGQAAYLRLSPYESITPTSHRYVVFTNINHSVKILLFTFARKTSKVEARISEYLKKAEAWKEYLAAAYDYITEHNLKRSVLSSIITAWAESSPSAPPPSSFSFASTEAPSSSPVPPAPPSPTPAPSESPTPAPSESPAPVPSAPAPSESSEAPSSPVLSAPIDSSPSSSPSAPSESPEVPSSPGLSSPLASSSSSPSAPPARKTALLCPHINQVSPDVDFKTKSATLPPTTVPSTTPSPTPPAESTSLPAFVSIPSIFDPDSISFLFFFS